jgi:prespore-specific regulator
MQMLERWVTRSDSWTTEDDRRLADIVLRHIREGSTQLKAFVECADLLGRTPAACGYRWNGVVRKHYEAEIKQAKLARKKNTSTGSVSQRRSPNISRSVGYRERLVTNSNPVSPSLPLQTNRLSEAVACIQAFESSFKDLQAKNVILEDSIARLKERIRQLEEENDRLREAPLVPISQADQLTEDSKTLLSIMERARKMLGTELEPVVEQPKVKFRMDRNGNLERIHL